MFWHWLFSSESSSFWSLRCHRGRNLVVFVFIFIALISLLLFLFVLLWEKLEDILLIFWYISKQMLGIAILHFILMEGCNFYFIRVFSSFFQIRIKFLFQLYSDRLRMGVWFSIWFVIIFRLFVRTIFFWFTKLKTTLMALCIFIRTSCWLFAFLSLLLFKISREIMCSLT